MAAHAPLWCSKNFLIWTGGPFLIPCLVAPLVQETSLLCCLRFHRRSNPKRDWGARLRPCYIDAGTGDGGTLAIEVTTKDGRGNIATTVLDLSKNSHRIEVVNGGIFVLLPKQPPGESFTGQEIEFTVGGQEAAPRS